MPIMPAAHHFHLADHAQHYMPAGFTKKYGSARPKEHSEEGLGNQGLFIPERFCTASQVHYPSLEGQLATQGV